MNFRVPTAGRTWIAILVLALLTTSLQAKLGLYRSGKSPDQFISKEFKPAECRLERVPAAVQVAFLSWSAPIVTCQVRRAEPRSPDCELAPPRQVPITARR